MPALRHRAAVVGAGLAGARCAQALQAAGWMVEVFEKARGAGGRLATRRAAWCTPDGLAHTTPLDHGAPGFEARGAEFHAAVAEAAALGLLRPWMPRLAAGGIGGGAPSAPDPATGAGLWVVTPDMPAWCRHLLAGATLHTGRAVDALVRGAAGWQLFADGAPLGGPGFDAVVVAVPPMQAAPLLAPHRADWAARAQGLAMAPCWTLMGVTPTPAEPLGWDLARPAAGPLAQVMRNDARPGRRPVAGEAHWVVQATAAWSQAHLEAPAAEVMALLQEAAAPWLGPDLAWHHAVVHRWRYATVAGPNVGPGAALGADPVGEGAASLPCWWDAALGVGACGDALGGGGVAGAWQSGHALATAVLGEACAAQAPAARACSAPLPSGHAGHAAVSRPGALAGPPSA